MKAATKKQTGPQVNYSTNKIKSANCLTDKETQLGNWVREIRTAVTVSMHNTKGSEVRYLESLNAYSFHN